MSVSHNDAVLDRVLTRIVTAGNQKSQSRSPARGIGSSLQRDTGTGRSLAGVEKRKVGSTARLHGTYRLGAPAFSSTARDSSLAGTNTVVPQIVFSKSILKVSGHLLFPVPSTAGAPATSASANAAAPTSSAQNAPAAVKPSAIILRQQPHALRNISPQLLLRGPRSTSSPSQTAGGGSARSRSSPRDAKRGGGGVDDDGGGDDTGRSPRDLPGPRIAAAGGRSRSSPRDTRDRDGPVNPGDGTDGSAPGLTARRATVHGEPPNAGTAVAAAPAAEEAAGAQRAGRAANTITRTAALRALKQQRATTPDLVAELRARSTSEAGAGCGERATDVSPSDWPTDRPPAGCLPSARTQEDHRLGGASGGAGRPPVAQGSGSSPHPPAPLHRLPPPPPPPPLPQQQQLQVQELQPQGGMHPGRRPQDDAAQAGQEPGGRQEPAIRGPGNGPQLSFDSYGCGDADGEGHSLVSITARPAAAAASAASACNGGGSREASVRSPSPRRSRAGGGGWAVCGGPWVVVGGVAQRQQRAMRQHLQRQTSPSPGRRQSTARASLERLAAAPASVCGVLSPPRPQQQGQQQGQLRSEASWQNDVVLAAQTRIRRLEEQVLSLTTHVAELQASHADLEFQLEEEQQHHHQARKAATTGRAAGGGGGGKPAAAAQEAALVQTQREQQEQQQQQEQEKEREQQRQQLRELRDQVTQLQQQLAAREAEAGEQVARARAANDTLAKQNRALYSTLEETLSAAEHAAQELKQLRTAHTQLQGEHETSQQELTQLREDLELRERALSAVQAEFNTLRRRHEEALAAAEAARRDAALRDGRLRRELEVATQEAATLAAQLTKLQREHQQLHCRKAEKDRQLAALAKRADTQQEQLAGAERLAQEQAALVRELESRATLLRNRNAALDRALTTEKDARQAAQEQVRQMEEEIALLVAIVRQSDPTLETLARYKADPAAAAALAAAAAAAAAAALLHASPSPTRSARREAEDPALGSAGPEAAATCVGTTAAVAPAPPPVSTQGGGGSRRQDPTGHSVVTITAGSVSANGAASDAWPMPPARGHMVPVPPRTAPPPLPGTVPLTIRAPPPGTITAVAPSLLPEHHPDHDVGYETDASEAATTIAPLVSGRSSAFPTARGDETMPESAPPNFDATVGAAAAGVHQPDEPQSGAIDITPRFDDATTLGALAALNLRYSNSRDGSPLAMAMLYPAKHCMTSGVFLAPSGRVLHMSSSPRASSPGAAGAGRSRSAGGGPGSAGTSPRWMDELRLAATAAAAAGGAGGGGFGTFAHRRSRTPPGLAAGAKAPPPPRRGRRVSDSETPVQQPASSSFLTSSLGRCAGLPAAPPARSGSGGSNSAARRSTTPRGTSGWRKRGAAAAEAGGAGSPNHWSHPYAGDREGHTGGTAGGGGGSSSSPPPPGPLQASEVPEADRVFWARARRADSDRCRDRVRERPASTGSAGLRARGGGAPAAPFGAQRGRGVPQESGGGGGGGGGGASYAAMSARRALETSVLTGAVGPQRRSSDSSGAAAAAAAAVVAGGQGVGPRAGPMAQRGGGHRRARTPEPRTVAAWAKLAEQPAGGGGSRCRGRKRASTPDGRRSNPGGRGSDGPRVRFAVTSAVEVSDRDYPSDRVAELAALLLAPNGAGAQAAGVGRGQGLGLGLLGEPNAVRLGIATARCGSGEQLMDVRSGSSGGNRGSSSAQDLRLLDEADAGEAVAAAMGLSASPVAQAADQLRRRRRGDCLGDLTAPGLQQDDYLALLVGVEAGAGAAGLPVDVRQQSETIRASYAFGSPSQPGLSPAFFSMQPPDLPAGFPARLTSAPTAAPQAATLPADQLLDALVSLPQALQQQQQPAAAAAPAGGCTGQPAAAVEDPLGAALRGLQQRQAQLLQQLAATPPAKLSSLLTEASAAAAGEDAAGVKGGMAPQPLLQLSPAPAAASPEIHSHPLEECPGVSSFSFSMPLPQLLGLEGGSSIGDIVAALEGDGAGAGAGAALPGRYPGAAGAGSSSRASMDQPLHNEPAAADVPVPVSLNGEGGRGTRSGPPTPRCASTAASSSETSSNGGGGGAVERPESPPPHQGPPRSPWATPRRPSVTAAAAAAVAAGAGVGGPLTALLDQLEKSDGGGARRASATPAPDALPAQQPPSAARPAVVAVVDEAMLLPPSESLASGAAVAQFDLATFLAASEQAEQKLQEKPGGAVAPSRDGQQPVRTSLGALPQQPSGLMQQQQQRLVPGEGDFAFGDDAMVSEAEGEEEAGPEAGLRQGASCVEAAGLEEQEGPAASGSGGRFDLIGVAAVAQDKAGVSQSDWPGIVLNVPRGVVAGEELIDADADRSGDCLPYDDVPSAHLQPSTPTDLYEAGAATAAQNDDSGSVLQLWAPSLGPVCVPTSLADAVGTSAALAAFSTTAAADRAGPSNSEPFSPLPPHWAPLLSGRSSAPNTPHSGIDQGLLDMDMDTALLTHATLDGAAAAAAAAAAVDAAACQPATADADGACGLPSDDLTDEVVAAAAAAARFLAGESEGDVRGGSDLAADLALAVGLDVTSASAAAVAVAADVAIMEVLDCETPVARTWAAAGSPYDSAKRQRVDSHSSSMDVRAGSTDPSIGGGVVDSAGSGAPSGGGVAGAGCAAVASLLPLTAVAAVTPVTSGVSPRAMAVGTVTPADNSPTLKGPRSKDVREIPAPGPAAVSDAQSAVHLTSTAAEAEAEMEASSGTAGASAAPQPAESSGASISTTGAQPAWEQATPTTPLAILPDAAAAATSTAATTIGSSSSAGGGVARTAVSASGPRFLGRSAGLDPGTHGQVGLLDRAHRAHHSLLSLSRSSLGALSGSSSSVGGSGSSSAGGAFASGNGGSSSSSAGGSASDWLQQHRRPQSPSVKPLSLAEVLRRPPSSSR